MGFFSSIEQKQIRSFTKGACRAMLASFLAFEDQMKRGKIEARLFSDLATKALSTRPGWKLVEERLFEHKSGTKLKIEEGQNLADVILGIVLIEMKEYILNDNNPEEMLDIVTEEFKKFFSSISENEIENVVKNNQEWTRMLGTVTMRKFGHK